MLCAGCCNYSTVRERTLHAGHTACRHDGLTMLACVDLQQTRQNSIEITWHSCSAGHMLRRCYFPYFFHLSNSWLSRQVNPYKVLDRSLPKWSALFVALSFGETSKINYITIYIFVPAFHDELEYRYGHVGVNRCAYLCTPCRNSVNFGPVAPDITSLVCVQQASSSIGISLTTFGGWLHR